MTGGGAGEAFSITPGVEEELFLVDPATRDLLVDVGEDIFGDCVSAARPHKVVRELVRSQIETNTRVCASISELRTALGGRSDVAGTRG